MKRVFTATCLAATFAVGLAAQSTGTSGTAGTAGTTAQDPQSGGGQRGGGPRTVTGCLRAGDTAGSFMLTDVAMQGGRRGGDATAGAASTTAGGTGSTAGTTASGAAGTTASGGAGTTASGGARQGGGAPASLMLTADSSVDLKPHVGHKVEVIGTMAGGGRRGDAGASGTATGTGTTASGTTAAGGTTAGGATTGTGTGTTGATAQGGGRGRSMTVTSVRMIAESCS